jgi:3-deoxy-manno-octulosonate cytidylyltransferase (CMP-KDO synthetase)
MRALVIIPARYASTRFPAKPLALLGGRPIIEHVYRQASKAVADVVVATDDERILSVVEGFGGRAVMTSTEHQSGTDRCYEALQRVGDEYDIVINVQGDEPFIQPEQITSLIECFNDPTTDIATMVKPFSEEDGIEALENPNSPKVVLSRSMKAIYFSRSVIPYMRGVEREEWLKHHTYYKHLGIYAFRSKVLAEITALPQSPLELSEKLEQLRWLESGYVIGVATTNIETIGIDTPEDLARAEAFMSRLK